MCSTSIVLCVLQTISKLCKSLIGCFDVILYGLLHILTLDLLSCCFLDGFCKLMVFQLLLINGGILIQQGLIVLLTYSINLFNGILMCLCLFVGTLEDGKKQMELVDLLFGSFLEITHHISCLLLLVSKERNGRNNSTNDRYQPADRISQHGSPKSSESHCSLSGSHAKEIGGCSLYCLSCCICLGCYSGLPGGCSLQDLFLCVEISLSCQGCFPGYCLVILCCLQLFLCCCNGSGITSLLCPIHLISCCLSTLHGCYCCCLC